MSIAKMREEIWKKLKPSDWKPSLEERITAIEKRLEVLEAQNK